MDDFQKKTQPSPTIFQKLNPRHPQCFTATAHPFGMSSQTFAMVTTSLFWGKWYSGGDIQTTAYREPYDLGV